MSEDDKTKRPDLSSNDDRTVMIPTQGRRRAPTNYNPAPLLPGGALTPRSSPQTEDWITPSTKSVRPVPASLGVAAPILMRRKGIGTPNENPILRTAMPLLLTLGGLRVSLVTAPASDLMEEVAESVMDFEGEIKAVGISEDKARTAKYILCATADDIVQNLPGDRNAWTQYSMLSRFFGERNGGIIFFDILDRLKTDPLPNVDLLEFQHACMTLGFEGMHRTSGGSTAELQRIQRNLYETIRRVRRADPALSPRWQGKPIAAYGARFQVPLWIISAVLGVFLFGFYMVLRTMLSGSVDGVALAEASIHPAADLSIQRRIINTPPPPPPPPTTQQELQLARIKRELTTEIAAKKISVEQTADEIIVRLGASGLFASADAQLSKTFGPINESIVKMLENEVGTVKITGYTDNSPLRVIKFGSNYDLSLARAKTLAASLRTGMSHPERIKIAGRGEQQPIGDNDTKEGRALNRRVEIAIPRVD